MRSMRFRKPSSPSRHPRRRSMFAGVAVLIGVGAFTAVATAAPRAITVVAGNGKKGYAGDHHAAIHAKLDQPRGVAALPGGGFLIADTTNSVIRKVSAGGRISTVAGNGVAAFGGDNGPATSAKIFFPQGVAALPGGGFLIADSNNERIREVSPGGEITTVAGNGMVGYMGDNGPATMAKL